MNNNLEQFVPNVNKISDSGNISSMHGVSGLPSNREYFAGRGGHHHGGHHGFHHGGLRPGMRGLRGYGLGYNPYVYYNYPVAYVQSTPTCGGQNCTTFYNSQTKEYESAPNSQCTCCDMGKTCRTNPPDGVKYDDCCPGLECKNGYCMK